MIDIKITDKDGSFKFRTCIILKYNNKVLLSKMRRDNYYYLPGGHIELGESSYNAAIREFKEELGIDIKIKKLLAINENFFKRPDGKIFHELAYYYIATPIDENQIITHNYVLKENDKGQLLTHEMYWFDKKELESIDVKPHAIKEILFEENLPLQNIIKYDFD